MSSRSAMSPSVSSGSWVVNRFSTATAFCTAWIGCTPPGRPAALAASPLTAMPPARSPSADSLTSPILTVGGAQLDGLVPAVYRSYHDARRDHIASRDDRNQRVPVVPRGTGSVTCSTY